MARANSLDRLRPRRFDLIMLGSAVVMALVTAVLAADVDLRLALFDWTLDVAVNSWLLLMAGGLALLTLPRYRDSGRLTFLLQVSAFVLATAFGVFSVAAALFHFDDEMGMSLGSPRQGPLYMSSIVRIASALLFLLAAVAAIRRLPTRLVRPRTILLAPIVIVTLLTIVCYLLQDWLPPLIDEAGIREILPLAPDRGVGRLSGITPLATALVVVAVIFMVGAAILFRTVYVTRGPVSDGFLAVGLVIVAFAELQVAYYPSVYTGLVTSSDFIRLLGYGVFLLGIGAEQRSDLRALREAYAALDRLRISEAERAALEERSHLAREIHDGLAQHLWFAKLKFERLSASVTDDDRPLAGEVGQALDAAIIEARQALVTMRTSLDTELPLSEMLKRTVDDFGQRSGIKVSFSVGAALPSALPPRQQIEVLRVVQEALTNVRKHADATVVRVRADTRGRDLFVTVADNGKGFDPNAPVDGLGLQGMEERARLLGGTLRLTSEPQGGTTVELSVPLLIPDWLPMVAEAPVEDSAVQVAEAALPPEPLPTPAPSIATATTSEVPRPVP